MTGVDEGQRIDQKGRHGGRDEQRGDCIAGGMAAIASEDSSKRVRRREDWGLCCSRVNQSALMKLRFLE